MSDNTTTTQGVAEASPPLAELKERFKAVMACQGVTDIVRLAPPNSANPPDEGELLSRAKAFAPGMRALIDSMFSEEQ